VWNKEAYTLPIYFISRRKTTPSVNVQSYIILFLFSHIEHSFFRCHNPLSSTMLSVCEDRSFRHAYTLHNAFKRTSPACWSWRVITLMLSHRLQFIISFTTNVNNHYSLPHTLHNHKSSPDWLHAHAPSLRLTLSGMSVYTLTLCAPNIAKTYAWDGLGSLFIFEMFSVYCFERG